jgi:glycosyltransferase involved in cell wall biosynthesis
MKLRALFWNYMDDTWVSHIALSLAQHMRAPGFDMSLVSHASDPPGRREFTEDGVPPLLRRLVYRFDRRQRFVHYCTKRRFLRDVEGADAVYLWPGTPIDVYRAVQALSLPIIVERVNCHRIVQRRILGAEFARLGLDPEGHGVTRHLQVIEDAKMAAADCVFAPSPLVVQSLLEAGVPRTRIIPSSYGWSPERLRVGERARDKQRKFTVLFVGTLCIRKGAHRLLEAWAKADIDGELLLAGEISDLDSVPGIGDLLGRSDVKPLGYVKDIASVYAQADVFAFPSLEEGSPLVTYEAMAHGLPVLVSPMGGGAVVRDDVDGFVREPHDIDGQIAALRALARDADLRARLGRSARARAADFTWAAVGRRRREALLERFAGELVETGAAGRAPGDRREQSA